MKFEEGSIDQNGLLELGLPARMAADYILLQRMNSLLASQVKTLKEKLKNYKQKVKVLNAKVVDLLKEKRSRLHVSQIKENVNNQNSPHFFTQNFHRKEVRYPIENEEYYELESPQERYVSTVQNKDFYSFGNNRLMKTEPGREVRPQHLQEDLPLLQTLPVDHLFRNTVQHETQDLKNDQLSDNEQGKQLMQEVNLASSMNSSKYYFEKCKQISSKDLLPLERKDFQESMRHDVLVSKGNNKQHSNPTIQDLLNEGELLFPNKD